MHRGTSGELDTMVIRDLTRPAPGTFGHPGLYRNGTCGNGKYGSCVGVVADKLTPRTQVLGFWLKVDAGRRCEPAKFSERICVSIDDQRRVQRFALSKKHTTYILVNLITFVVSRRDIPAA